MDFTEILITVPRLISFEPMAFMISVPLRPSIDLATGCERQITTGRRAEWPSDGIF